MAEHGDERRFDLPFFVTAAVVAYPISFGVLLALGIVDLIFFQKAILRTFPSWLWNALAALYYPLIVVVDYFFS